MKLIDFSIYSPNFNHDTFCIVTAPNGLTTAQSGGYVLHKLKLVRLPYGVEAILIKYELILKMIMEDDREYEWERKEQRLYSYKDTGKNEKDESMILDLFQDAKQIEFCVSIQIIEVRDKNGELAIWNWNKYGIHS